ncbi:MAG: serine acetyltransferase [Spirochaetales bacterium]|jgi:serine O-acetyltransferase|nr:serine O-acetyltransferase EpsC [Sphaerochaetaceae bacterium]NLV83399.1 serine acetyltransferase [Spirochaetales bacterium]
MTASDIQVEPFIDAYIKSFDRYSQVSFLGFRATPSMEIVEQIVEDIMELLFPGRSGALVFDDEAIRETVRLSMKKVAVRLENQIFLAWYHANPLQLPDGKEYPYRKMTSETIVRLLDALPTLRAMMKEDAKAAFDGDPAATSIRETIICYPGVKALTIHRIAHFLYDQKVPLIPRMLSETVHKQTGIDIHPGAKIGRCLFIDHGTGVVIGETTVIGNQVKLYQGVTLGALSFPKDACGSLVRGSKRHPTLEDRVTVYANATLLGDITIGENTIIGSSVWIKESVPANTLVQLEEPKIILRQLKPAQKPKDCPPVIT